MWKQGWNTQKPPRNSSDRPCWGSPASLLALEQNPLFCPITFLYCYPELKHLHAMSSIQKYKWTERQDT